jgi:hypothetical protein
VKCQLHDSLRVQAHKSNEYFHLWIFRRPFSNDEISEHIFPTFSSDLACKVHELATKQKENELTLSDLVKMGEALMKMGGGGFDSVASKGFGKLVKLQ